MTKQRINQNNRKTTHIFNLFNNNLIMRKYFLSMLAMAAMLLTVSCSKDAAVDSVANQSAVSFNISTPELTTRAVGDGTTATNLYWAVYGEDGKILPNISNVEVGKGKQFTLKTNVTVSLVRGKKYSFIFWAENENGMCSIDWDAKTMTIEPKLANQEGYDAFWAYYELEQPVNGTINETIELYRPFAQLNIGTSDKAAAADAGMAVKETKISVATFNTLDLVNGTTTGSTICTYDFTDIAEIEGETFPVAGNSYLSMNYLLVSKSADAKNPNENDVLSGVKFEYKDEAGKAYSREFYNIPVKRNWKTNIYGTLLTNEANFKVEIKPAFDGENLEQWNGEEMIEPQQVDGVYHVSVAAHLAWILNNCSKDVNMSLDASIDFGGYQIPVNSDSKFENLTIEGNGNTIYNFVNIHPTTMRSSEQGGMVALFPIVYGANVNGLNIKDATVDAGKGESAYAAILFGHTFGTVELNGVNIEDCDVKGTNKVGGLIAMANADGTKTIANNCHVKNTNITTHDVKDESGLAGGFFGYINNGTAEIFSSSVEGGKFTVINSRGNNERANGKFIGGIGSAKVTLDSCSANVTDYNETGAETYVPHNEFVGGKRGDATLFVDGVDCTYYKTPSQLAFEAAIVKGGTVTLSEDVEIAHPVTIAEGTEVIINLNGKTITGVRSGAVIKNEGILEIVGDGTIENTLVNGGATINNSGNLILAGGNIIGAPIAKESGYPSYCITNSGNLTIEDGTSVSADRGCLFLSGTGNTVINGGNLTNNDINDKIAGRSFTSHVVVVGYGANNKLTINGGTFQHLHVKTSGGVVINNWSAVTVDINGGNFSGGNYFGKWDNLSDYGYGSTKTPFAVKGGSFTGMDSNYIASGYKAIEKDGKYYVVENTTTALATTSEELTNAVTTANAQVNVAAGTYTTFPSSVAEGVTIICEPGTVFKGNSKLNINGATVIGAEFSNPGGNAVDQTINGTFKNCKFTGSNATRYCYSGETVVFEDCVFDGDVYGVHFDGGANDVIFRNCTLSGFNGLGAELTMVTFEGCTFKGNGKSGYNGANLWGSAKMIDCEFTFDGTTANEWIDCIGTDKTYEFTNCTINGVKFHHSNYKEYSDFIFSRNHTTVKINGVNCKM